MTKKELIKKVSKSTGQSLRQAGRSLDAVLDAIKSSLKKEETVTLVSFGSFSVTRRKARKGRHPRTGEPIDIAATTHPKFSPSRALKDIFRKKQD
jgi:DNA-binding protein HU-beta